MAVQSWHNWRHIIVLAHAKLYVFQAEVVVQSLPLPGENGFQHDFRFMNFGLYNEFCVFSLTIISPLYNILSSNFAVILILARCFQLQRQMVVCLPIFKFLRSINLSKRKTFAQILRSYSALRCSPIAKFTRHVFRHAERENCLILSPRHFARNIS